MQLGDAYRGHFRKHMEAKVQSFADHIICNPGRAWDSLRYITTPPIARTKVGGTTPKERIAAFHAHFTNLFTAPPPHPNLLPEITLPTEVIHFHTGPFSLKELDRALAALCNRRAPGPDGIPNEVLKLQKPSLFYWNCANIHLKRAKLRPKCVLHF